MPNRSYQDFEDEMRDDKTTPYDSISSRGPLESLTGASEMRTNGGDVGLNEAVKNAIMARAAGKLKNPLSETRVPQVETLSSLERDPMMQEFNKNRTDLNDYRRAKSDADFISNLGQSFSQLSQGVNAPKENTQLYSNLNRQNQEMLQGAEGDVDRRQKVISAIEARKSREGAMANAAADRREARALRQQNVDLMRSDRMGQREEKQGERELALGVPGFERTGEVLPKPEEAAKFRKATATAEQLSSKLNRMRDLVGEVGSFEYGGSKGQEMESLATEIQLLSKNQDMYDLGVLTGPDMGLLQKITADPSSFSSLMTRDSTRKTQIDTQLKSIQNKLESTGKSLGYKRNAAPLNAAAEGQITNNMSVRIQAPDGSIRLIPKEKEADAVAAGGKRI
jgi:hypothetical protein